jgi:hypothetical protein
MTAKRILFLALMIGCASPALRAQQSPGEVVLNPVPTEQAILAAADVQPAAEAKNQELMDAIKTFNQVLWDDLSFSGYFIMASKSYYPLRAIVKPEDVKIDEWSMLPFKISYLSIGSMELKEGVLQTDLRIMDMKQCDGNRCLAKTGRRISGSLDQVRTMMTQEGQSPMSLYAFDAPRWKSSAAGCV